MDPKNERLNSKKSTEVEDLDDDVIVKRKTKKIIEDDDALSSFSGETTPNSKPKVVEEENFETVEDEEFVNDEEELIEDVEDFEDEEYEVVEDEELVEDVEDFEDEEYEIVDDEELVEDLEDFEDEEYEVVDDEEELVEDVDDFEDEEYEVVDDEELVEEDIEDEEYEVVEDEEYEVVDDDEEELIEEDIEDEEYEVVDEEEELVEEDFEDEEYEVVDDEEELVEEDIEDEEYEVVDEEELVEQEVVEEKDNEDIEETTEEELDGIDMILDGNVDVDDDEEEVKTPEEVTENDEENSEAEEVSEDEEEIDEEYSDEYDEEEIEDEDEEYEVEEGESMYPDELVDFELECIYLGLLFNNPKAISRFYFVYEDCRFSDDELMNLYKIIIFRDGEAFAPAIAKDKYQLPRETPNTYDLRLKVKKIAASKEYNLEHVYKELKKLFILKKNYVVAPTAKVQEKILEIQKYKLYDDMTVEEVESALDQIMVTTGLTQGRLNEDTTSFLLAGDNALSNGISIPFNILSTVFKGLRKGETMCYAMPSNSGKSRFTINLAAYISFVHKEKVLIISNEMSEEKMRLCMITTILNNPEIQKFHGQNISKTEGELLELKFRPDKGKRVKCDENGFILRKDNETQEEYIERLRKNSTEFKQTIAVTDWVNTQINNSIFFIHITEHTNDDLRKIIMNYYYKEGIQYMFYDTLKADTANIGNSDEVKKTATILSNLAQKFRIFIASSMQLLESTTLPVNLTINDMSASKTVKEVLDTLCLIKQISRRTLHKYEYSDTDLFEKCSDIDVPKDTDVRFYACVVDKNRAGAKPTVLFKLNLAYNRWEELGHVRLKQTEVEED